MHDHRLSHILPKGHNLDFENAQDGALDTRKLQAKLNIISLDADKKQQALKILAKVNKLMTLKRINDKKFAKAKEKLENLKVNFFI